MKNEYEVRGDITAIFIRRRNGDILETLISTSDLEKVKEFPYSWCVKWDSHVKSYYVLGLKKKPDGRNSTIRLHRYILDPPKCKVVDHINHDTLDNTRGNLRIVTNGQNQQNKRIDYTSVPGISYFKRTQKWLVSITVEGKDINLGYYRDIKQAENIAIKARIVYMPFSKEAMNNQSEYTEEDLLREIEPYRYEHKLTGRKSKSGHHGVGWDKRRKRWTCHLRGFGKPLYLGSSKDKQEAIEIVKNAREEYMREVKHT